MSAEPPPLYPLHAGSHSHLSIEQRWAIVVLHKDNQPASEIAYKVSCHVNTVYHWLSHFRERGDVSDEPRSGRPRGTTAEQDAAFSAAARAEPFASRPRDIKRKQHVDVSRRTIRRRLNDDLLFGRVSRHFFPLSDHTIRARLSFASGYGGWTVERWMEVMFSDEKIFTLGQHGQVWVQRPRGEAWSPKYCYERESHPDSVNFWCCFSGRGTGGCESFTYSNTGAVMRGIVNYHLLSSARKLLPHSPPAPLYILWDNSPIHKSLEVRTALHKLGVTCLDFPPYSPDLNPTENLFADLARRVEQRFPQNEGELEEAIHTEWSLTNTDYLRHLATSMPRRCQAVLRNQGHKTKY
jgi:transposase